MIHFSSVLNLKDLQVSISVTMYKTLGLLFLAFLVTSAFPKAPRGDITSLIKPCDVPSKGEILQVTMKDCDAQTDSSCPAKVGQDVEGTLTFMPTAATDTLACELYGNVAGVWLPLDCPQKDACTVVFH